MTREQFLKASKLYAKIDNRERLVKKLESLFERTKRIAGSDKKINVQIGEQYLNTPQAEVRVDQWIELIEEEKKFLNEEIVKLREEIASI